MRRRTFIKVGFGLAATNFSFLPLFKKRELYAQIEKLWGVCYSPFRHGQSPDEGVYPSYQEIEQDIAFLSSITTRIRTFGIDNTLSFIPLICKQYGLECSVCGYLLGDDVKDRQTINNLIEIANNPEAAVNALVVGNETLLFNVIDKDKLKEYLQEVKQNTSQEVTTAEPYHIYLNNQDIATYVDFVFAHIYPYWESISVINAAQMVIDKWNQLRSVFPSHDIRIGETGWPTEGETQGEAVPTESNQRRFLKDLIALTQTNNTKYFVFSAFDEAWKIKPGLQVEGHWGLFYSNGQPKEFSKEELDSNGFDRDPSVGTGSGGGGGGCFIETID